MRSPLWCSAVPSVLITRPREDAERFAAQLAERGVRGIVGPLSTVHFLPATPLDSTAEACVVVTSRHALMHPQATTLIGNRPLAVVGDATAALAKALGLSVYWNAPNVLALTTQLNMHPPLGKPRLWYLRGAHIRHDLRVLLPDYAVEERTLYRVDCALTLPQTCRDAFAQADLTGVAFFSTRHAEAFIALCTAAGETPYPMLTAYCMSAAIAEPLRACTWRNIRISSSQTSASMLELMP